MLLRQPQHGPLRIDWANPITKGLALSMLPSNGFVDVVTGEQYIPFGTAPVISTGAFGKCLDSTTDWGGIKISPARNICTVEQTHILLVEFVQRNYSYAGMLTSATADGSSYSFALQDNAGGVFSIYPTGTTLPSNIPFGPSMIVVSGDASGSIAYKDGEIILASGPAPIVQSNSRFVLFGERVANANYSTKGRIYFHASFTRRLSVAEIKSITRNPWQIYADHSDVEVLKSSGGGATVITCNTGTATTAGIVAGISSATTLACNVGGATTAGVACALPIKIACNVGNATPTGIACSLPVVVQCNAGTATTAGVSAGIALDSSITISCNAGTATTSGVSASFPQTLSCTPGNATTAGVTAGIAGATTISCNVGNVSVAGITAGISSAITISCNAGTATTSGIAASFPQTLSCNVGNATTAGITAQVDIAGQIVIGCNVGTATTAGIQASVSSAIVLACSAGTATTLGATAYFPQSLQCSPGNAIALGIDATFTVSGPTTIVCNVGNATASGVHCYFGGRLDAPPDAIVTVINKRNRVSVISRRS